MPWWGWVLVWVVLFALAGGVFTILGLGLWRQVKDVFREAEAASTRFAVVSEQLQELSRRAEEAPEPAVFGSPSQLRQQRVRSRAGSRGFSSRAQRLR